MLDFLESLLIGKGYRLEKTTSMKTALERYYHAAYDVVVIGFGSSPDDAVETIRLAKMMDPAAVLLVIADKQHEADTIRGAMRAGAYDYAAVPFHKEAFTFAVERAVDRRRLLEVNVRHERNLERLVAERTRDLLRSFDAAIFGLAKLVEYRDEETGFHLERLSDLSAILARRLSKTKRYKTLISDGYVNHIRRSAPLHDIGKVGIPDSVLLKPGRLTKDEFDLIKMHTLIGAEAISAIQRKLGQKRFFNMGMLIAKCHHEKWDGAGYPNGLKSEAIPLSARIVALADVYDALRSERPYKRAWTHEEARDEILSLGGKHFDPDITDAFKVSEDEVVDCFNTWQQKSIRDEDTVSVLMKNMRKMPFFKSQPPLPGTGKRPAPKLDS